MQWRREHRRDDALQCHNIKNNIAIHEKRSSDNVATTAMGGTAQPDGGGPSNWIGVRSGGRSSGRRKQQQLEARQHRRQCSDDGQRGEGMRQRPTVGPLQTASGAAEAAGTGGGRRRHRSNSGIGGENSSAPGRMYLVRPSCTSWRRHSEVCRSLLANSSLALAGPASWGCPARVLCRVPSFHYGT